MTPAPAAEPIMAADWRVWVFSNLDSILTNSFFSSSSIGLLVIKDYVKARCVPAWNLGEQVGSLRRVRLCGNRCGGRAKGHGEDFFGKAVSF